MKPCTPIDGKVTLGGWTETRMWLITVTCVDAVNEELVALLATIENGFGEGIAPGAR